MTRRSSNMAMQAARRSLVALVTAAAASALPWDRSAAQEARSADAASSVGYEDRLIDGGALEIDSWTGDVPTRNAAGWPRSLRLDGIYSQVTSGGHTESNTGFGLAAMLATPSYGAWTVDGLFNVQANAHADDNILYGGGRAFYKSGETTSLLTIWQRGMPFDDGWFATNGLGMLNTPAVDLARFQPRWILPTLPLLGGSSEWRDGRGTQLVASVGEPGLFTGSYVPGFRRLGGQLTTVGGQWQFDRNWTAGLQYMGANDATSAFVPFLSLSPSSPPRFDARSGLFSTGWQEGPNRVQMNMLSSSSSFADSNAGAWVDAQIADGRALHGIGAHYMGPDLVWGNQQVGFQSRGAYYRINYLSRQWIWDAYVDYTEPTGSDFSPVTYGSGSVRYQWSRDIGTGVGGSVRDSDSTAWSAFAFVDVQRPWVLNRTQISTAQAEERNEVALSANQTWNVPAGTRLNSTVAVGRYDGVVDSSTQLGLGLSGGGDLAPNVGLDLNLQWFRSTGEVQPTTLNGNLTLNWRFLPQLALLLNAYRTQVRTQGTPFPLTYIGVPSPISTQLANPVTQQNDRGLYVILRFETRAGSMSAPLGGAAGGGAGSIVGHVFLDGNEDGRFTALETSVPSITVVLDGRFSVRTDSNGRFEFPSVAAGRHVITALPDNVPLAWHLVNDGRREVDVPIRGIVNLDLPAQRIR